MIIPKYWAEAKIEIQRDKKTLTLKRYGWSDLSIEDAQIHAESRVAEASEKARLGQSVRKNDHKIAYSGNDGLPIREEIFTQYQDIIITRNSYGALCLNTPDVLFADVDFNYAPSSRLYYIGLSLLLLFSGIIALLFKSWIVLGIGLFFSFVLSIQTSHILLNFQHKIIGNPAQQSLKRIREFSKQHPTWHLRVYRTPKGYRVLVMHQTFEPNGENTQQFFSALQTDVKYTQLCKIQNCFRARVSPKPWRIGLETMSMGVWPVSPDRLKARNDWLTEYHDRIPSYASCHFEEQLGSQITHEKTRNVQSIHDRYCHANTDLELA